MTGEPSVGMEELERRLRGGDAQALAELFSRERERLWRIVKFRLAEPLRGRLDPDDVLQEAFLAASQRDDGSATRRLVMRRTSAKPTVSASGTTNRVGSRKRIVVTSATSTIDAIARKTACADWMQERITT